MNKNSDPSDSEHEEVPSDILEKAKEVQSSLLPDKSRAKYEKAYENFMEWRSKKKIKSFSEPVFLAYFDELSKNQKPTSLWAIFSMVKSVVATKHSINIFNYKSLMAFLKKKKKGHYKAKVLEPEQINQFLDEAPDHKYLGMKVALIFGIQGACRRQKLCDMTVQNIVDKNDMVVVNIPKTKTNKPRTFVITGEYYEVFKKYSNLRPQDASTNRFFLQYKEGKCSNQVMGINTFGNVPKMVAIYLQLPQPELYTGHTFRRTAATLLADSGANLLEIKRLGGWESDAVAATYIEDSIQNKVKTSQKIIQTIKDANQPNTSKAAQSQVNAEMIEKSASEHSENSDEECNSDLDGLFGEEEKGIVKKIKLESGGVVNLRLMKCSNINIYINGKQKN